MIKSADLTSEEDKYHDKIIRKTNLEPCVKQDISIVKCSVIKIMIIVTMTMNNDNDDDDHNDHDDNDEDADDDYHDKQ